MIRVVIADDHALMREGLKRILEAGSTITIIGEASNGIETLSQAHRTDCDLLLMDLSMPGESGIELLRKVRQLAPKLPILVLTMHREEQYAVHAIHAGAGGYLVKDSVVTELVDAIEKVVVGQPYVSTAVAERLVIEALATTTQLPHQHLSHREFEVFSMMVHGNSITDIATTLHLSVKTVSTHKTRILQKMLLKSLAELVRYAVAHGLLPPMKI